MIYTYLKSRSGLAAALALSVVGASTFNILPVLVAGSAEALGFSERQAGLVSTVICVTAAASALLAGIWVRAMSWRRAAALAVSGMLAAYGIAMIVHAFWRFLLIQAAGGLFTGATFSLAMTILSDRPEAARTFGISNALQVIYQIAVVLAGPLLIRVAGLNGVLAALAVPSGLALCLVPLLPARGRTTSTDTAKRALLNPATIIALLAFGASFMNSGAYWSYAELMAAARGMTSQSAANSVVAGLAAGVVGGILAWAVGDRVERLQVIAVTGLLMICAGLLLSESRGAAAYVIASVIWLFAWNLSYPYQLAAVNGVDSSGRGVAVTLALGLMGTAGGAGLAAWFVSPKDYRAVTWLIFGGVCVSSILFVASHIIHKYGTATRGIATS